MHLMHLVCVYVCVYTLTRACTQLPSDIKREILAKAKFSLFPDKSQNN